MVARRRLQWLGHIARMDDHRLPKAVLFSWLHTPRPAHGPRRRWRDVVRDDLKAFGLLYTPVGTTSQLNVASGSIPSRMLLLHGAYALKRQPSQCVVRSVSDSSPVKADFGGTNAGKSD